jgi:cell division protease FtsH
MVTQYGMSDKLGPLSYGDNEEEVFLGHSITRTQNLSDDTQKLVDVEIHRMVDEGYMRAKEILEGGIEDLHIIAKGLLEYETLSGQEMIDLLNGKPPLREFTVKDDSPRRRSAVPSSGHTRKNKPTDEPDLGGMEPQTT